MKYVDARRIFAGQVKHDFSPVSCRNIILNYCRTDGASCLKQKRVPHIETLLWLARLVDLAYSSMPYRAGRW